MSEDDIDAEEVSDLTAAIQAAVLDDTIDLVSIDFDVDDDSYLIKMSHAGKIFEFWATTRFLKEADLLGRILVG